jgi:DNA transformation protein
MAKAPTHYLADMLAPWGTVEIKRMFGGLGAWRDGVFFALIADDIVYFKVDADTRREYARLQSEAFSYRIVKYGVPNLKIIDSLWRVPDEILEDPETLALWAQKAFDIARSKPDKATAKAEAKANSAIEFKSLGRKYLPLLREIGIASSQALREAGAIAVYERLKAAHPKQAPLGLLWTLYAVANRIDPADITPDIKDHLKMLLNTEPN